MVSLSSSMQKSQVSSCLQLLHIDISYKTIVLLHSVIFLPHEWAAESNLVRLDFKCWQIHHLLHPLSHRHVQRSWPDIHCSAIHASKTLPCPPIYNCCLDSDASCRICSFERRLLLFFESLSNLKIKNASAVVIFWSIILTGSLGQESGLYSLRMPNKLNFGFDYYYASILGLISYLPGKLPTSAIFHETVF